MSDSGGTLNDYTDEAAALLWGALVRVWHNEGPASAGRLFADSLRSVREQAEKDERERLTPLWQKAIKDEMDSALKVGREEGAREAREKAIREAADLVERGAGWRSWTSVAADIRALLARPSEKEPT